MRKMLLAVVMGSRSKVGLVLLLSVILFSCTRQDVVSDKQSTIDENSKNICNRSLSIECSDFGKYHNLSLDSYFEKYGNTDDFEDLVVETRKIINATYESDSSSVLFSQMNNMTDESIETLLINALGTTNINYLKNTYISTGVNVINNSVRNGTISNEFGAFLVGLSDKDKTYSQIENEIQNYRNIHVLSVNEENTLCIFSSVHSSSKLFWQQNPMLDNNLISSKWGSCDPEDQIDFADAWCGIVGALVTIEAGGIGGAITGPAASRFIKSLIRRNGGKCI